jgi:hypothetical protein
MELKEDAGIECLLYPMTSAGDGHGLVDEFLCEARKCSDFRGAGSTIGSLATIRALPLAEQLQAIGAINRHLLAVMKSQVDGRLKYAHVLDPHFEQVPQGHSRSVLGTLSQSERLYRVFFLASLGLLSEQTDSGTQYFAIAGGLRDLDPALLAEEGPD